MKTRLGMIYVLYYYGESKPSDDKDNCHIGRVKEDGEDRDVELVDPLNQFMAPSTF